jgi:hypothetical protein
MKLAALPVGVLSGQTVPISYLPVNVPALGYGIQNRRVHLCPARIPEELGAQAKSLLCHRTNHEPPVRMDWRLTISELSCGR